MTIQSIIQAILAKVVGETAPATIKRKQAEINAVVDRNTAAINTAVDAEIDSLRTQAQLAFGRITDLLATGAVNANKSRAVDTARAQLEKALQQLDAVF